MSERHPIASGAWYTGLNGFQQAVPVQLRMEPVYVQTEFWELIRQPARGEEDKLLECRNCAAWFAASSSAEDEYRCPRCGFSGAEVIGWACPEEEDQEGRSL